jgi:cell wall-associated NlpC family hydrolase
MMRLPCSTLFLAVGLLTLAPGCARRAPIPGRDGYVTHLPVLAPPPLVSFSSPAPATALPGAKAVPQRDANVWRAAAEPWLGTPYRLGGNSRTGIDCSGFARVLHAEVSHRKLARTTTEQWRSGAPVNVNQLRPGDLLFFNTTGQGVSHVGVFMEGEQFAHASTSKGVIYSSASEPYWAERFLGARRP